MDMVAGGPNTVRHKRVKSPWGDKEYSNHYITIDPKVLEALGWERGAIVMQFADEENDALIMRRMKVEKPV